MIKEIKKIADEFNINGELISVECKNSGNINKTYVATYKMPNNKIEHFIIQKINTTVFKEPYKLMKNISNVTSFIQMKTQFCGDNIHPCLNVIKSKNNKLLVEVVDDKTGEKQYYRSYNCIENSISYDVSTDKNVVYKVGQAFGHFQRLLSDYDADDLETTIPDFHNTPKRFDNFMADIELDVCDRADEVSSEIITVLKNRGCKDKIANLLKKGTIPTRVTHNDTKVNNVMMNKDTGDYLTVIDLDTVMPGSALYDYGDGVRSTCATAVEDEQNLDIVELNMELFKEYTKGYLSEMADYLTEDEVCNMGESIRVITFELALRFLNDYINGDTYFKTTYDKHNLVRTRNQLKLLSDIDKKMPEINKFILNTYKKCKQNNKQLVKIK
ncbi:MAG: phosphotransferase [Bacilli bacterium]|nr:phosphotransferase [Bacilli bacterium]